MKGTGDDLTIERTTAALFDLTFKNLIKLSSPAIVRFINGLFGTDYPPDSTVDYPSTESVSNKLKKLMSDTIIVINGKHVYHVEAEISDEDENMAVRVFEYGYAEGLRTKAIEDDMVIIKFPNAKVIFWETTSKAPDMMTLRLMFPDGNHFDYEVQTFKFLEHSIFELEERKMAILLPFYVLKLRKQIKAAKSSEKLRELSLEMQQILNELTDAAERCVKADVICKTDMWTIHERIKQLYSELYMQYPEFEEVNKMLEEKLKNSWEEVLAKGLENGLDIGVDIMRELKNNAPIESIAAKYNVPVSKVQQYQAFLGTPVA